MMDKEPPFIGENFDKYRLRNGEICVRRGFRLTESNKRYLGMMPTKKSVLLNEALRSFFHCLNYKKREEEKQLYLIASSMKGRDSPLTGLWIESKLDWEIRQLIKHDNRLTIQLICNYALDQYFKGKGL